MTRTAVAIARAELRSDARSITLNLRLTLRDRGL
jgi:hypothetical protein